jgi:hypothetical protein
LTTGYARAVRSTIVAISVAFSLGCGPNVVDDVAESSEGGEGVGERPSQAGAMYSACSTVSMCAPLEFCVFPSREGGYCSAACNGNDSSGCAPPPGNGADLSCLDIGEPMGRLVCALDCSHGACPTGMRCEGIEDPSGSARNICF